MPETITLTQPVFDSGETCNILQLNEPLGFPAGWIWNIAKAVWLAPENDELWQDQADERRGAITELGERAFDRSYCRRPGAQTKVQKGLREKIDLVHHGVLITVRYPPGIKLIQLAEALESKAEILGRQLREESDDSSRTSTP